VKIVVFLEGMNYKLKFKIFFKKNGKHNTVNGWKFPKILYYPYGREWCECEAVAGQR
jgi:hypothetical protein